MGTLTANSRAMISSPLPRIHQPEAMSLSFTTSSDSSGVSSHNSKLPSQVPAYTDDDVQGMVQRFVGDLQGRYRASQVSPELLTFLSHWLCEQLQEERQQWNAKLTAALSQIETERRQALAANTLVQVCLERLQLLVQCCSLRGADVQLNQMDVCESDLPDNPQHTILLYTQTLMEVYSHLVEDHLQCLELLDSTTLPKNARDLTVADLLQERLGSEEKIRSDLMSRSQQSLKEKQQSLSRSRQNQALEAMVRSLESDVGKLRLELKKEKDKVKMCEESADGRSTTKNRINKLENDVQRLKKLLLKKQDYTDWLKNQFFEMTQVVAEEKRQQNDSQHVSKHRNRTAETVAKEKKFETSAKVNKETVVLAPTIREVNLTRSPGSVKSAGTDNSSASHNSIEISEDKLNVLKMKANKLEDSLRTAMNQMSEYAAKVARKSLKETETKTKPRITDLASKGVILKVPKRINMLHAALGKSSSKTDGEAKGHLPEPPRNGKIDKSFKELQNSFANRRVAPQNTGPNISVSSSASMASPRKNQVSKCFRCKKIFRLSDNHKLACCFHLKGKERIEKYGEDGKLKHVSFVWQCCGQKLDSTGCCTGHHV